MKAEVSARVVRALFGLLRERGIDPSPLLEVSEQDTERLMDPAGWITNEEFVLIADRARRLGNDPDLMRSVGRRVALRKDGALGRMFRFGNAVPDLLSHFPRLLKLIDLNHSAQVTPSGSGVLVSVRRPGDGFHTRDHCLLFAGLIAGLIEAGGAGPAEVKESSCLVPIDQAGEIKGRIYRFDQDRRLLVSEQGQEERDLGPWPGEGPVEAQGSVFGADCCEYEVKWRRRALPGTRIFQRLAGPARVLLTRDVPEEEFGLLASLPNSPVRWEASYAMTRTKYFSYAAAAALALVPPAWALAVGAAGPAMLAAAGYSVLVLAAGLMMVRAAMAHGRSFKREAENAEAMLQGSGVAVVSVDQDFTVTYANRHALKLYGRILGRKCYEAFRWDTAACAGCKAPEAFGADERQSMERLYIDREGRERWNYVTLSPIRDADGRTVAVSHAAVDVQEKKELELEVAEKTRALEESEAKYKNYISNAADAILIVDLEFNIVESNRQMAMLVGLDPGESLAGTPMFEAGIIPKAERQRIRELAGRMLTDRHPRQFEMELVRRDGDAIDVEVRSIPMLIHGEPAGWQSIFRDITARKREEFEKNLLLSISQSIKEAPDLDTLARTALSGICAILDVPAGSLFIQDQEQNELKLAAAQGLSEKDLTVAAVQAADWSSKGGVASRMALFKKNIVVPDLYDLKLTAPVRNRLSTLGLKSMISMPLVVEGRLEGVIQLLAKEYKDFSEQRQAVIERVANELAMGIARQKLLDVIRVKNKELMAKNQEIENATMQLLQAEKMASIGQLAAGVAHEINNPMGYIASNLNVLGEYREDLLALYQAYSRNFRALEGHADEEVGARMEEIRELEEKLKPAELLDEFKNIVDESKEGAKRVKTIVADLREFSHPQSGTPQWFDLHDGLSSTLNIVWNELKYKATVEKEFGEIPQVKGFPQELNQVFMNMLVNAAQAINGQGHITIRTYAEDGSVCVEISDSGVGIAAENLSRIFDPFFTTKEVGKGTGLGLAICYRIVQKHGGEIKVNSEVGKGTTFIIRLPVSGPGMMKEAS
ncbi:MAG TPA: PAS domain S-box protein [bacterium]|nr:PAS domain S-box protein [bacterium]